MKMSRSGLIACALLWCFSGCTMIEDLLDMQPLTVTSYTPAERFVSADQLNHISIDFSRPVDRTRVEEALTITDDTGALPGRFSWNQASDRISFLPHHGFVPGRRYEVVLSTAAEDRRGNSLDRELGFDFLTRQHDEPPRVRSHFPPDGSAEPPSHIRIEFSSSMDRQTVQRSVSFSPGIRTVVEWTDSDRVVRYTPIEPLIDGNTYLVVVGRDSTDAEGNRMSDDYRFSFTAGSRSTVSATGIQTTRHQQPLLPDNERLINHHIVESNDRFEVWFSGVVPASDRATAVSFSPSLTHLVQWNDRFDHCTIFPQQPLRWDEEYEMSVLNRRYRFSVTGPESFPPRLHGVAFSPAFGETDLQVLGLSDSVELIPLSPVETQNDNAVFDFAIHHAAGASVVFGSFLQELRISSRNGVFSFTVHNVVPAPADSPFETDNHLSVFRVHVSIRRNGHLPFDIIALETGSNLSDSYGNLSGTGSRLEFNGR